MCNLNKIHKGRIINAKETAYTHRNNFVSKRFTFLATTGKLAGRVRDDKGACCLC